MNSLEVYIFKRIKEVEDRLSNISKSDLSKKDYDILFNRLSGQKSILYECLTAHDNKYCQQQ
jgi:hypothetical protein